MDGNKDEAARCIRIAESSLAAGDKHRALKLLRIARRLDSSLPVDALLAACASPSAAPSPPLPSPQRQPQPASSNGGRSHSDDHALLIREIKKHRDYYAILGVDKTCSADEIRRAYRKLSLKVHPDKNAAPGAEEAFKAVSKAFKCLSDESSRRQYDHTGPLEEDFELHQQRSSAHRRRRRNNSARNDFFDDEFDPDEIFRSFFFNTQREVFRAQRARAAAAQQRQYAAHSGGGGSNFIMCAQISVILLFLLFAYLPFSEPPYSMQKTYSYVIPKTTKEQGVEYFVKSQVFDQKYPPGSLARDNLERGVLRDYKSALGRYCHMELQRRQWSRNYPTPHCDKLRNFGVT